MRGYGTGSNIGITGSESSWCTSGSVGKVQSPAVPNITGVLGGLKGIVRQVSGAFNAAQYQAEGVYGSGGGGYYTVDFYASRSDSSYGRRARDVAPLNYAVKWFIKY